MKKRFLLVFLIAMFFVATTLVVAIETDSTEMTASTNEVQKTLYNFIAPMGTEMSFAVAVCW